METSWLAKKTYLKRFWLCSSSGFYYFLLALVDRIFDIKPVEIFGNLFGVHWISFPSAYSRCHSASHQLLRARNSSLTLYGALGTATATATATRTSKKQWVYYAKQQLGTCTTLFCTFRYSPCTTTTWKCLIASFMEDVNKRRRISFSLSKLECASQEINSREIRLHLPLSANWNKRDKDWKDGKSF